ncbi:hypothetical protein KP509_06G006200 [Ceratopteris richardii]|uniref:GTD-binding domain-containing protein n=1 Tax=Ceratopteris richardii TaxID=49495 RepID=A0A8T2UI88_CERRI|nr:hypothetical protein KP509_06G006200 [Ceratopteris richardii]
MDTSEFLELAIAHQEVHRKKRCRLEANIKKQHRNETTSETDIMNEMLSLKEALKSEQSNLRKLHLELQKERSASMSAANEAMSMITRLQEEKAAVLVEARCYKLAAEERESHDQQTINLVREALVMKEDELLVLKELIETYREALMRAGGGSVESRYCIDKLPFVQGANVVISYVDSSDNNVYNTHDDEETFCSESQLMTTNNVRGNCDYQDTPQCKNALIHDDVRRCQDLGDGGYYEDTDHEQWLPHTSADCDTEAGSLKCSPEQALNDMSASIFTRVQQLEERFELLRENQALELQWLSAMSQFKAEVSNDGMSEKRADNDGKLIPGGSSSRTSPQLYENEGTLAESLAHTDHIEEDLSTTSISLDKVQIEIMNEAQELCCLEQHEGISFRTEFMENNTNVLKIHHSQATSFSDIEDDDSDNVHDVYEVQSNVKGSFLHPVGNPCLEDNNEQQNLTSMQKTIEEVGDCSIGAKGGLSRIHMQVDSCVTSLAQISVDESLPKVKDVHSNAELVDEELQQLKIHLEALESERFYLTQVIDSLRKENMERRALQALAQQLSQLKMDSKIKERREQGRLPFVILFKRTLSYIGFQSFSARKSRCSFNSPFFCKMQKLNGLHHILDDDTEKQRNVYVLRKCRMNLIRA